MKEISEDLYAIIQDQLKFDPLYHHIQERPELQKELFNPTLIDKLSEDKNKWYRIAEVGMVLGDEKPIPASTLKHYIDNMRDYIVPDDAPNSKFIRLNYLSIIKLKMIWLLKDEFRLNGLQAEVGILGTPVNTNPITVETNSDIKKYMAMTEMLFRHLTEYDDKGNIQLKNQLIQLLGQETLLTTGLEQNERKLKELEDKLKEEQNKRTALEKTLQDLTSIKNNEEEVNRVIEREKELSNFIDQFRFERAARTQAEKEWDSNNILKRLFGNRSEFIEKRTVELLKKQQILE